MPVNTGLTFLFGGILGWIAVRLLKPEPHLEGLITAMCSTGIAVAFHRFMYLNYSTRFMQHIYSLVIYFYVCIIGNLGNLVIIIVPAICTEEGSPFGDHKICSRNGLSYSSFSMAVRSSLSN